MKSVNLTELSNQELLQEAQKQKNGVMAFRILMVLMTCAAVWNATHKGSFIISCLPLFFMPIFVKLENNYKALQTEIQNRKM